MQTAALFIPGELGLWDLILEAEQPWARPALNALYLFAVCVVEPFYVAGGFGFYINRRIYLEGWDIDLTFRKLASRVDQPARVGIVVALALALGGLAPAPIRADEQALPLDCAPESAEDARR